jgi:hypothetical protein
LDARLARLDEDVALSAESHLERLTRAPANHRPPTAVSETRRPRKVGGRVAGYLGGYDDSTTCWTPSGRARGR